MKSYSFAPARWAKGFAVFAKATAAVMLSLLPQSFYFGEDENMGYPGRQNIYDATIRRMVQKALEEQEQAFALDHETDTDEQLLHYLRESAIRLHHTPWPGEILGGSFIQSRFGSWSHALIQARLPAPRQMSQSQNFARVQAETERQREIYRQRKLEKKKIAAQRRAEQAARKRKEENI